MIKRQHEGEGEGGLTGDFNGKKGVGVVVVVEGLQIPIEKKEKEAGGWGLGLGGSSLNYTQTDGCRVCCWRMPGRD